MSHTHPGLIFGTASVGDRWDTVEAVNDVFETLKSLGINRLDTAGRYPSENPGASERLLGEAGASSQGFIVDTKILVTNAGTEGTLRPEAIDKSVKSSNKALRFKGGQRINVLYCHMPDQATPLEDQARALNEQYKAGHFEQLGVSNWPPDVLEELIAICEREGYIKPTVYQGRYSLVNREVEGLFEILRKHGMVFNAFSPLAAGFLSGKFTAGEAQGTRFDGEGFAPKFQRMMFDKPELHDAIHKLNNTLEPLGISKIEASLRWICYHSRLGPDDGIILGASKTEQLVANKEAIDKGPLPDDVVGVMNDLWKTLAPKGKVVYR